MATSSRTAFVIEPPAAERSAPRLFEPEIAALVEATLEDRVLGAWEELIEIGDAECPACGGRVALESGGCVCGACGSELS